MNHILKIISIFVTLSIIITGITPTILSQTIQQQTVYHPIEVNNYYLTNQKTEIIQVTTSQLETISEYLHHLHQAIDSQDIEKLKHYQKLLKNQGITIPSTNPSTPPSYYTAPHLNKVTPQKLENQTIDNSLCFLNIQGQGTIFFTIATLLLIPTLLLVQLFGTEILNLLLPIYLAIFVATHIIPFRVMLPIGNIMIDEGSITATGINGRQELIINGSGTNLMIAGFTGVTLNIPSTDQTDGLLSIIGFSLMARTND